MQRALVVGASGLVGAAVCARLMRDGWEVTALQRNGAGPFGTVRVIHRDITQIPSWEDWLPHLGGMTLVVNCAGTLQDSARDSTVGVHADGPARLFEACERAGVQRVIHFSAIGVDRAAPTPFSRSKRMGDAALEARDLDWVILRPSVILGRAAFGASAMIRGLAALPLVPVMPDTGALQVVALDDVVETVAILARPGAPSRIALDLAGPERLEFAQIVAAYRRWLGWPPARTLRLPRPLAWLLYGLGDVVGVLGWRPPIRSNAGHEVVRGATGDPARWTETTGIVPRRLEAALRDEPAGVQERWFAGMYFLKPVILVTLPLFWILTGVISLTNGYAMGVDYLQAGGLGRLSGPGVVAGAIADMAVGAAIAWRPSARLGLWAGIAMSLFYAVAGTLILPVLWNDPVGPMLKIWPIIALHLAALVILRAR